MTRLSVYVCTNNECSKRGSLLALDYGTKLCPTCGKPVQPFFKGFWWLFGAAAAILASVLRFTAAIFDFVRRVVF